MGSLKVCQDGVVLHGAPGSAQSETASKPAAKSLQAMRLELEDDVLDHIVRSAQSGGKGVHLNFGKNITLEYGNRSKQLTATVQHTPTEIYSFPDGKDDEIAFTALQSHRLALRKAHEDTLGADIALTKLQNSLLSAEREKQSRQIQLASNNVGLPPAVFRRNMGKNLKASSAMKPKAKPINRPGGNLHSAVNSPSLGAITSPQILASITSEPSGEDAKVRKSQALRIPLIHFLAVRPVSEKYLVQTLRCEQKDCQEVLQRVGKQYRLDPEKWDLHDKAFKELDLWKFNYPNEDDRQLAVDRAVSAFDRLRLPKTDPLRQKLLHPSERNKGKVLSNLNLNDPKTHRGATPRINVQPTDDSAAAQQTPGQDSDVRHDRLDPNDAEQKIKSKPKKAPRGSENESQLKGPQAKDSKAARQTGKAKETIQEKPPATNNGRKRPAPTKVQAKSSEFVHDSDEEMDDEDMISAPALKKKKLSEARGLPVSVKNATDMKGNKSIAGPPVAQPKPTVPKQTPAKAKKISDTESPELRKPKASAARTEGRPAAVKEDTKPKKPAEPMVQDAQKRSSPLTSTTSKSGQASSDSSQASGSLSKSVPRQRTASSPHKPSPLGSSPPTNASDFDNDSRPMSSTSSTPLIAHARSMKDNTNTVTQTPQNRRTDERPPMKQPLKRKAVDDDAENHAGGPPLSNGALTNGYSHNAKRHKASPISPPTSESGTDSSTDARRQALEQARDFKIFWSKYQALYMEVAALPKNVPSRKFDDLMKMHERLAGMKADIRRATLQ